MPRRRRPETSCDNRYPSALVRAQRGEGGALRCATEEVGAPRASLDVTFVSSTGSAIIAEVTGEIDLRTAESLKSRLLAMSDAGFRRIVLDFTEVRFCDASGLGALVAVQNRLSEHGGEIKLARVRPTLRRLLRITGLDRLFTVYDQVGEAVAGGGSPASAAVAGAADTPG